MLEKFFLRNIERLIKKEQPPKEEKKEGKEGKEEKEIQRLELDPEKNIDIVIKEKEKDQIEPQKLEAVEFMEKYYGVCKPLQVLIEKNGKVMEDFWERVPDGIFAYVPPRGVEIKTEIPTWRALPGLEELTESEEKKFKRLKSIIIPDKWQSSESIIYFLHELGHVIYHEKNPNAPNLVEKIREIKSEQSKISERLPLNKINKTPTDEKKYEEDKKRYRELERERFKIVAQLERNAWVEALRLVRELKRNKDIDLLKPFRDKKTNKLNFHKLKEIIHESHERGLGSYEHGIRLRIKKGLAPEDLKGIFTRKYNEEKAEKA